MEAMAVLFSALLLRFFSVNMITHELLHLLDVILLEAVPRQPLEGY